MATSCSLRRCYSLFHPRICSRTYISRRQRSWCVNTALYSPQSHHRIYNRRWCSQDTFKEPDSGYLYAQSHEWASTDSELTTIGISHYAQEKLGDVVYVELPSVGDELGKGDQLGVLESVKAAADVNMPVGGCVVEINEKLDDSPELINQDSYKEGWLVKLKDVPPEDLKDLMPLEEYKTYLEEGAV